MAISAKDLKKKLNLSPEREAKIAARAATLIEQEHTLADLRRARRLTQVRIAKILDIEQDGVSRMERRADMLLSTMDSYIQAMGGKLKLVVEFPDREPVQVRLSALSGSDGKRKVEKAKRSASAMAQVSEARAGKTVKAASAGGHKAKPEAMKTAKRAVSQVSVAEKGRQGGSGRRPSKGRSSP